MGWRQGKRVTGRGDWGKLRGKHAVRMGLMTGEQGGKKAGWYREGQVRQGGSTTRSQKADRKAHAGRPGLGGR
jgi:hypothetical protein